MESFRNFVHKHISRPALFTLVFAGVIGLSIASKSLFMTVEATLAEFDSNTTAEIKLANVYQNRLLQIKLESKLAKTPPSNEVPDRSLARGERSKEVLLLQNFLKWKGYYPESEESSSYFGELTLDAVKKYQEERGIEPEGIVGPLTRQAWLEDVSTPN